ncbi:MAG: ComF family protein [Peptostreptococcaceae bacterium]
MKELLKEILEIIYPKNITCLLCFDPIKKDNTYSLCKSCFNELKFIKDGCFRCGRNIINSYSEEILVDKCIFCSKKSFDFERNISCIEYDNLSKKFIFDLKYRNKTYITEYISKIMLEKLDFEGIKYDYILCVPLHKKRLKSRGFNQAKKIAEYLSELVQIEFLDILKRNKNTKRLFTLDAKNREKELKSVFDIENGEILENKNILIVDDIFTTGSTVNEISKALSNYSVGKIYTITFITKSV